MSDNTEERRGKETLLALSDIAPLAGVTLGTLRSYFHKDYLPQPDVTVGVERVKCHAWRRETIDAWLSERAGKQSG